MKLWTALCATAIAAGLTFAPARAAESLPDIKISTQYAKPMVVVVRKRVVVRRPVVRRRVVVRRPVARPRVVVRRRVIVR